MATLEELFAEISDRRWIVNNLFQLANGLWQANLRNNHYATDWGKGCTPHEALSIAIDKLESAPLHHLIAGQGTYSVEKKPDLIKIVAKITKSEPLVRRI